MMDCCLMFRQISKKHGPTKPSDCFSGSKMNFMSSTRRDGKMRSRWRLCLRECCSRYKISVDRKSTRLNSSHSQISYAVFCLKKKKKKNTIRIKHRDINLHEIRVHS